MARTIHAHFLSEFYAGYARFLYFVSGKLKIKVSLDTFYRENKVGFPSFTALRNIAVRYEYAARIIQKFKIPVFFSSAGVSCHTH